MSENENTGSLMDDLGDFFDRHTGMKPDNASASVAVQEEDTRSHKEKNIAIFYERLKDLGVNLDELEGILECRDNLLVGAGAGAGKTTMLVLRLIRDYLEGDMFETKTVQTVHGLQQIVVPQKVLVSTFLRSGALELQKSFYSWCNKLNLQGIDGSVFEFRTIHSEVMDALRSLGVNVSILDDSFSVLKPIMQKYGIRSANASSKSITVEEMKDVEGILAYARNRLDSERYNQPLMQEYSIDSILLDAVLADTKMLRQASGRMDFEDAQEMLLEGLRLNEKVREVIASRYARVIVDEFQDTSQLQYELLKYYFASAKRIIVVGDDDQTIYSWRGSDNNIITEQFAKDINPTIMTLTTNYRCKSNILEPVIPSLEKNKKRLPKTLRAYAKGGEMRVVKNGGVEELIQSINADRVKNHTSGVLARVNADLLIPTILLELDGGIEFSLSKSVSMKGRLARQVFGSIDLITKRVTGDFEMLLRMFVPKYSWDEARKITSVLNGNRGISLMTISDADLKHSVPNLYPFLDGLRKAFQIGGVEAYLYILEYMLVKTFATKSSYSANGRALVNFVIKLVMEHSKVSKMSVDQLGMLFNETLPAKIQERTKYATDTTIKLTTVHEAKGKEWDSVYVWNFVDGVFPNTSGSRDLTEAEYEEERRISYIAMTRAKEKLTVFTDTTKPSPFLAEFDMSKVQLIEESVISDDTVLYQKRNNSHLDLPSTDKLLLSYVEELQEGTRNNHDAFINYDMVIGVYTREQVVEMLDSKYGFDIEPHVTTEMFDNAIADIIEDMFRTGKFQA